MAMSATMSNYFSWVKAVPLSTTIPLGAVFLLWAPLAVSQNNLGQLLDAGAKQLSPEEFRLELVQHEVIGPTDVGGSLEVMYASNGQVQGQGTGRFTPRLVAMAGEWKIDGNGAICTSMRTEGNVTLPFRCQFWFKNVEQYFVSDSDSDRKMRVLRRTVKQ
jgi:hypothetical protein